MRRKVVSELGGLNYRIVSKIAVWLFSNINRIHVNHILFGRYSTLINIKKINLHIFIHSASKMLWSTWNKSTFLCVKMSWHSFKF